MCAFRASRIRLNSCHVPALFVPTGEGVFEVGHR